MANDTALGHRGGLVRCFAEFHLLPDLLRAHRANPGAVGDWSRLLDDNGYNEEHVGEEFVPEGEERTGAMAEDAVRFCRWTGLILADGNLSAPGRRLADVGGVPPGDRGRVAPGVLTRVLAERIQASYLGVGGLRVADLLRRASSGLAWPGHAWPRGLRGLLLMEMNTLVHWAFVDAGEAERLVGRLIVVRDGVVGALAGAGRETVGAEVLAGALARVHWRDEGLALNSELTLTELRSTALALIFAEVLAQSLDTLPLQVLRPGEGSESAR